MSYRFFFVSIFCVCVVGFASTGAYFEDRLSCAFGSDRVEVGFDADKKLCTDYLQHIALALEQLSAAERTVGQYIDSDWDVGYRQGVALHIDSQKNELLAFQHAIDLAIATYERSLFARLKPLVLKVVSQEVEVCSRKFSSLSLDFSNSCWVGQDVLYETITESDTLDSLIPLVLSYLSRRG